MQTWAIKSFVSIQKKFSHHTFTPSMPSSTYKSFKRHGPFDHLDILFLFHARSNYRPPFCWPGAEGVICNGKRAEVHLYLAKDHPAFTDPRCIGAEEADPGVGSSVMSVKSIMQKYQRHAMFYKKHCPWGRYSQAPATPRLSVLAEVLLLCASSQMPLLACLHLPCTLYIKIITSPIPPL